MSYVPSSVPQNPESLPPWLQTETTKIAVDANFPTPVILALQATANEPEKPRAGMVVFVSPATGAAWDPGSGEGFYGYYNGAWRRLG